VLTGSGGVGWGLEELLIGVIAKVVGAW